MDTAVDPRPSLTMQQATDLMLKLYGVTISKVSPLPSYIDQNFLMVKEEGTKYVLKIMNSEDSRNIKQLEVQTLAMSFLKQHGVPAQTAIPTTTGRLISMEEIGGGLDSTASILKDLSDCHLQYIDCGHGAQTYCVRLMTYLPGKTIAESPLTKQDLYHVGQMVATVDKTLQILTPPNLDVLNKDDSVWNLFNIPLLEGYLSVMDEDPLQEVVKAVIEQYKLQVLPKINSFQKGIIHGDLSDQNIIVTPADSGKYEVSGILDFSHLMNGYYVFELAVTIMYLMLEDNSPLDVGGVVLAGWKSIMVLNDDEKDSLFWLVLGRFCQSLVYGQYNVKKYPDNKKYLLNTARNGKRLLAKLWEMGKQEVERKWFSDASTFSGN